MHHEHPFSSTGYYGSQAETGTGIGTETKEHPSEQGQGCEFGDDASALTEDSALRHGHGAPQQGAIFDVMKQAMAGTDRRTVAAEEGAHGASSATTVGSASDSASGSRPPSAGRRRPKAQSQSASASDPDVTSKWETTVDKNTGRQYWFNRYTRETSWKNPFP